MEILSSENEHNKGITQHELLWKTLASVERIETALVGNSLSNNKGLVHKVEAQGQLIDEINKRVVALEYIEETEEKTSKNAKSTWNTIASWVAAVAAAIALIFSFKK